MFATSGGGVNSCYNCVSATLSQNKILSEVVTRRAKTTSAFKQFFSSPSLVLKLGENFVIEMQFPAQRFRKEQLEIISHNKTQAVTASVSEAVQFCYINSKNFSGLLRRIAPRNDALSW